MVLSSLAALLLFTCPAPPAPASSAASSASAALPLSEPASMRLPASPFGESVPEVALAEPSPVVSRLALAASGITAPREPKKPKQPKGSKEKQSQAEGAQSEAGLGPERAAILLQSLTIPGWGQATLGHKTSARAFAIIEAGIWTAFVAFRVQESMRTDSYLRTAQLSAGIDLHDDNDEFRRIVGSYSSSDEYNLLVVTRDAANLYLNDPDNPDMVGYRAYIAEHSLQGDQSWRWSNVESFLRYGDQRQFAQKAGLRANAALGFAIANRLVSALHAARLAGKQSEPAQGWRLELEPGLAEPGRFRAALTKNF